MAECHTGKQTICHQVEYLEEAMRARTVLLSSAILMTGSAVAQDLTPSGVFEAVSPSIVVVEALNSDGKAIAQGSGVVTEPGVVVTNCHVLKQAEATRVRIVTEKWTAHVRHKDEARDLCSLAVSGLKAPSVTKRLASTLKVGESVYALGAPQGFELSLSNGIISSLRQVDGGTVLQVTAPISPGSSGGGLFDAHGQLIGITTLYLKESQQLNFAVPADWIAELPARSARNSQTSGYGTASSFQRARLDPTSWSPPRYPSELIGSGINGDVIMIITLSDKGAVEDVAIEKSSRNRLLDEAAKAAAWKWTYHPGQDDREAIRSRLRVPISFKDPGPVTKATALEPYSPEVSRARQQLVDYDEYMQKNDPTYASKRPKLNALVREIRKSRPPEEWLKATSDAYRSIDGVHPTSASGGGYSGTHKGEGRWVVVSQANSREIAIDRDSIEQDGEIVSVWYRGVFAVPSSSGSLAGVKRQMDQLRFNCGQATYTLRAQVLFAIDGTVLKQSGMLPTAWKPVVPATVNEQVMQLVCE